MKGTKPRKVHKVQEINHFKELLEMIESKYANNIAYQYKKDIQAKEPEYVEVTYKKYCQDVKALSTGLLEMGLENKRIAIIRKQSLRMVYHVSSSNYRKYGNCAIRQSFTRQ